MEKNTKRNVSLSLLKELCGEIPEALKLLPEELRPTHFVLVSVDDGEGGCYATFSHSDDLQRMGVVLLETMKKNPFLAEMLMGVTSCYMDGMRGKTVNLKQALA